MRKYLGRTSDNRDAMSYTVEKGDLSLTLEGKSYLGGVIGKCAGINNDAKITVDGVDHLLTHNYGEVHFHGESKGFDKQIFNVDILCCHVVLFYKKYPFMQNGYFGTRNRNRTCNYPLGGGYYIHLTMQAYERHLPLYFFSFEFVFERNFSA